MMCVFPTWVLHLLMFSRPVYRQVVAIASCKTVSDTVTGLSQQCCNGLFYMQICLLVNLAITAITAEVESK